MSEATWYVSTFHQINSSSFDKETAQFSTPFHTHPQTNISDGSSTYSPNDCFDLLRVPGCCLVCITKGSFHFLCWNSQNFTKLKINYKSVEKLTNMCAFYKVIILLTQTDSTLGFQYSNLVLTLDIWLLDPSLTHTQTPFPFSGSPL